MVPRSLVIRYLNLGRTKLQGFRGFQDITSSHLISDANLWRSFQRGVPRLVHCLIRRINGDRQDRRRHHLAHSSLTGPWNANLWKNLLTHRCDGAQTDWLDFRRKARRSPVTAGVIPNAAFYLHATRKVPRKSQNCTHL